MSKYRARVPIIGGRLRGPAGDTDYFYDCPFCGTEVRHVLCANPARDLVLQPAPDGSWLVIDGRAQQWDRDATGERWALHSASCPRSRGVA